MWPLSVTEIEIPPKVEISWLKKQSTKHKNSFTLPFKPQYQHAYSPHCSPYVSYGISWENLLKDHDVLPSVIISLILM